MDLAFGATDSTGVLSDGVVSCRSNGICGGVLCCFKTAAETHKMAICAFLQRFDRQ
jgi:hypothetical protein